MATATQLVIVAIPAQDDAVWKISSEKVPHLTLLYLGENQFDSSQIDLVSSYIEHASSVMPPFGLTVDNRGVLGPDNADVLFFDKNFAKDAIEFRNQLLQNDLIDRAYLSTTQFPEWVPHLTLGYPTTPAKKIQQGYYEPLSYVRFDKIALWTGDYSGPTFQLKYKDYGPEVAMSNIERGRSISESILEHHGVKGMKWGVHRERSSNSTSPSRKTVKADKKFEKSASASKTTFAVYNGAASHYNAHMVDAINQKSKYRNVDFTKPSKLREEYYAEHQKAFEKALQISADKLGTNASGTRKYSVVLNADGSWDITTEAIKHDTSQTLHVVPKYDSNGYIISVSVKEPSNVTHHGVKGMKWGVHKARGPASSDSAHVTSTRLKAKEGGGLHVLSNQELQQAITRMNLEAQYRTLTGSNKTGVDKGLELTKKILTVGKTAEDVRKFLDSPSGKAVKLGLKIAA